MTVGDDELLRLRRRINQTQMTASRMAYVLPTIGPTIHTLLFWVGTESVIPNVSFGSCLKDTDFHIRADSKAGVVSSVDSFRVVLADEVGMTGTLLASSLNSVEVSMIIAFGVRTLPVIYLMSEMIVRPHSKPFLVQGFVTLCQPINQVNGSL